MAVTIRGIAPRSPAAKAGLRPGDRLIAISGHPIRDLLDYRFYMTEQTLTLEAEREGRPMPPFPVRKGQYEDLGLQFDTYLMDEHHSCKKKCIFCFIDQLPKGLRSSLYFKDDDDRLSFLFGNYITMTNLKEEDIDRIIQMHISPINVSVHTTDPQLRVRMMKNPAAADSLRWLRKLTQGGIHLNTQLVLCPGINDGPELERTLRDLGEMYPALQSIACVPVGLTAYRQGLYPLEPYTKEQAQAVIDVVDAFSQRFLQEHGVRLAYPSDEFFLKAQRPIPPPAYYGEYNQLENGVGLIALLQQEFQQALEQLPQGMDVGSRQVSIATGVAAYPLMCRLAQQAMDRCQGLTVRVFEIVNQFFGENITVAGLVTAQDLMEQLQGRELGQQLLIPAVMLRHEQDKFLDDRTIQDVEAALGVPVQTVENDGWELLDRLTGQEG